jgi:DNA polymerase elongation subunit (family B)
MRKLKTLVLDVETAPILAYVWDVWDQNIALNQIKTDWYVIAWSAKWLGDPAAKIIYRDQRDAKNMEDDKPLLKSLWDLLNAADVVITQNGKRFDGPKLNARFIFHGMQPPSPYRHLDTYQIVKQVAAFTSNKLEYLTGKLCKKYKKLAHKKFPGMTLWVECLKGNVKAWDEMKTYNIHDVLATEEFYMKIRAWAPSSMPDPFFVVDRAQECGRCGGDQMQRRGERVTRKKRIVRYQCQTCGTWQDGETIKNTILKKAA